MDSDQSWTLTINQLINVNKEPFNVISPTVMNAHQMEKCVLLVLQAINKDRILLELKFVKLCLVLLLNATFVKEISVLPVMKDSFQIKLD